jgi:hypothetical protein
MREPNASSSGVAQEKKIGILEKLRGVPRSLNLKPHHCRRRLYYQPAVAVRRDCVPGYELKRKREPGSSAAVSGARTNSPVSV